MNRCQSRTQLFGAILSLAGLFSTLPIVVSATEVQFEFGLGPRYAPAYEGSDDYTVTPTGTFGLEALSFGALNVQPGDGTGFGIAPTIGFVGARSSDDHSVLNGIDDVDFAVELGGKVRYRWQYAEAFGALRKGVTGHSGVVADFGANAIVPIDEKTTLRVGPRLSFADQSYVDTYFAVPTSATVLAPHSASAGLKSAGVEMALRHDVSDKWSVEGRLGWNRLTDSIAESPIVKAGSRDQGSISFLLIRKFDWRF